MKISSPAKAVPWIPFVLFAFLVVTILAVGSYIFSSDTRRLTQQKHDELSAIASLKVDQIVLWRQERYSDAEIIGENPDVAQDVGNYLAAPNDAGNQRKILSWLEFIQDNSSANSAALLDTSGRVRMSVPSGSISSTQHARSESNEARHTGRIIDSDFFRSTTDGKIYIDIVIPIRTANKSGRTDMGTIILRTDPSELLYPLVQTWPTPSKTSETLLLEQQGDSVVFLNELRHRKNTALTFRLPATKENLPAAMAVRGIEGIVEGRDYREVPVLAALKKIPGSPWFMIAKVDLDEIYAPIREQMVLIGAVIVLLLLSITSGFALWWRNQRTALYRTRYEAELERKVLIQHFEFLIKYANDIIILTDGRFSIRDVNDRAIQSYGYTYEEFLKLTMNDLRAGNRLGDGQQELQFAGEENGARFETEHRRQDGSVFPVEESIRKMTVEDRIYFQAIVRDITERKRTENALRESEKKFRNVFEHSPVGKSMTAVDGSLYVNDALCSILGFTKKELAGKNWADITYPDDIKKTDDAIRSLIEGNVAQLRFEKRFLRKNGTVVWADVSTLLERDTAGKPLYFITSVLDITERKRSEERVQRLNRTYLVLSNINQLIVRERDRQKVLDGACRIAVDDGGFTMTWIGMTNNSADSVDRLAASGTIDIDPECFHVDLSDPERKREPTALAVVENCHAVCNDIEHDGPTGTWISKALGCGYKSAAAFPIRIGGKPIGAFTFYSGETFFFEEDEIRLLEELAMDVSYALESLSMEERRLEAERALGTSEARSLFLSKVLELSSQPFAVGYPDGRLGEHNEAFLRLIGYKEDELHLIGWNRDLTPPEWIDKETAALAELRLNGQSVRYEKEYIRKSGTRVPIELLVNVVMDNSGAPEYYYAFITDITDRKHAEHAIQASEKRYRSLFENMVEGYAFCKMLYDDGRPYDFVYLKTNAAFAKLTGLQDVDGRKVSDVIHGIQESDPLLFEIYGRVATTGTPERFEIFVEALKEWFSISVYCPEKEFFVAVFDVITVRKKAEEELRISNDFNELLLQSMPFSMDIVDEEGKIVFINAAMKNVVGSDVLGLRCWEVYKDNREQCIDCPLRRGIELDRSGILEQNDVLGGRTYQISFTGMMYRGRKAMLQVFQDVTEQKRLQQELLQIQKMESIGTLAGGIAHDFNNILGIILAYASMLEQCATDSAKVLSYGRTITQAVERGTMLVRQILTFARKTGLTLTPTFLPTLIRELISMLRQTFPKVVIFREEIEDGLPLIYADQVQIHQALLNLCVNARDAMPHGGEITIGAVKQSGESLRERYPGAVEEEYVCISVKDTGTGIERTSRERIFDPFFTTKELGKGTGLGLAVVYGIVNTHRGLIDVESELGRGTTFFIFLPAPARNEQLVEFRSASEQSIAGGTETILLVEDEEELSEMMCSLLKSKGYRVFHAKDGIEALEVYKERQPEIDIVVTDMGLPGMTGSDLFRKLKELDPDASVVLASGFFEPHIRTELQILGAKGFLQKPYGLEEFLRKIRDTLDGVTL